MDNTALLKRLTALFFLTATISCQAQNFMTNLPNRNKLRSLNGNWQYIVDPYETGYANFHGLVYDQKNPGSSSAYYNDYHPSDKKELVEYDFDKSPSLMVPGDWNTQKENLHYYEGTIWLRKTFDYSLQNPNRLFVYFGAVNYRAEVYLNGKKLGIHEGGFTPFQFEITGIVKEKGNYLVVKADNKRLKEGVPAPNTDWWNYGGITREVSMVEEPPVFIRDFYMQLKKGDPRTLSGQVILSDPKPNEKIMVSIPELKIEQEVRTTPEGTGYFEIQLKGVIRYWSPADPKLYRTVVTYGNASIKDDIGFRTIETKGPDILLNGNPVFLKGICIHEEIGGRRATGEADAVKLLTWAKELGCNYVRLAHYPHNEYMLRMADKMGLMVWEEIPVYWTIDFKNTGTFNNARNQMVDVVTRDKNRASVIIWSVANETPISDARNSFLAMLANTVRSADDTRLLSAALMIRQEKGISIIDDKLGEVLDIISINQYRGWYGGDLATAPDAKWTTAYNKPLLVSEFGGDAKQGLHGTKEERWTEEFQEYLYRQNLAMIEKMPNIRGLSPWILTDFRSPRRVLPGIQDGFNRKGLISDKGARKKAFFVLQNFYKKK